MKFKVNDTVTLLQDKIYNNGEKIKAGTKGIVLIVYPLSSSYKVLFDGALISHRILQSSLA